ncbi:glycosyl hydrolase family 79 C-terminal domain-containing protein [Kitasatospora sp. NPDC094015]|uniref:glycosyl hydrolase family 79 C-terminal domain-containing protein n=1 Tax=Kitasatospora sp. NPDC094015 TaxID=3155205 RepID=UPI003333D7D0
MALPKSASLLSAVALVLLTAPTAAAAPPKATPAEATVTIGADQAAIGTLPADFLGFSYESTHLESGEFDAQGSYPQLLKNLGPGVLRFGGNTVDKDFKTSSPEALAALRRLTDATGWRVIYSENGARFDAAAVTKDVAAVSAALGPALTALACGNEPSSWQSKGYRPAGYGSDDLPADAQRCLDAVRKGAPQVPFAGPDLASTGMLPAYAAWAKGKIGLLDQHYYAISGCRSKDATAAGLLSRERASAAASTIGKLSATAAGLGVPLRLSETNSISCGGIAGVTDGYASALWMADFLLTAAEHGAAGVNIHGGLSGTYLTGALGNAYSPILSDGKRHYTAAPSYYGMLLAHQLGTGKVVPAKISGGGNLAAHAVRNADGTTRVLLENLDGAPATLGVQVGSATRVSVLTMTAPGLDAKTGVTIQGASVAADGSFTPGAPDHADCPGGTCRITLAPYTAVVLGTVTAATPAPAPATPAPTRTATPTPSATPSASRPETPTAAPSPSASTPHPASAHPSTGPELASTGADGTELMALTAGTGLILIGGAVFASQRRRGTHRRA